jgi:hypothetical protein
MGNTRSNQHRLIKFGRYDSKKRLKQSTAEGLTRGAAALRVRRSPGEGWSEGGKEKNTEAEACSHKKNGMVCGHPE